MSCSSDDDPIEDEPNTEDPIEEEPNTEDSGEDDPTASDAVCKYFIAAVGADEASYVISVDDLASGTYSTSSGIETKTATYWAIHSNKYAYSLIYQQGNKVPTSSFVLDSEGNIVKRSIEIESPRLTSYGFYDNYIVLGAAAALDQYDAEDTNKEYPKYGMSMGKIDVEGQGLSEFTVLTENLMDDGEYFTMSGFLQSNGKLYTGLIQMGYSTYGVWKYADKIPAGGEDLISGGAISGTLNPNRALVAVFDNLSLENPTIIETDLISYPASRMRSQYQSLITLDDDGDIYVFSESYSQVQEGLQHTDLPSGVVRIKAGETSFDESSYINIQKASGGYSVFGAWHITGSGSYFLLRMCTDTTPAIKESGYRFAILNASTGSFSWITGLPGVDEINSVSKTQYFEDGKAYIGIQSTTSDLYVIDPTTAVATKGLTVNADGGIAAIGKLTN